MARGYNASEGRSTGLSRTAFEKNYNKALSTFSKTLIGLGTPKAEALMEARNFIKGLDREAQVSLGLAKPEPKETANYAAAEESALGEVGREANSPKTFTGGILNNFAKDKKATLESGLISKNALGKQFADDDARVFAYEQEGMDRTDAQAAVEAENQSRGEPSRVDMDDSMRIAQNTMIALQEMSRPIKFSAMTGARDVKVLALPAGDTILQFKLPTPKWGGKSAVVSVKYNSGSDTYGVFVNSTTGDKGVRYSRPENVYIDELKGTLEKATGMVFSLR